MFKTVLAGARYLEIWPDHPVISAVFPEGRVKYAMRWARRLIPPMIVFILLWNFVQGGGLQGLQGLSWLTAGRANWPLGIVTICLLLLVVLHGYYWAGKRAQLKLSSKQERFYQELCLKHGRKPCSAPTMYDLAVILKQGLAGEDHSFLDRL